jgi:DNA-binding NarL/FixJ family response regulator
MKNKHRVLIVDDHDLLRLGLVASLELDARIEVVGEAADGREAIQAVGRLSPHLVLMDLTMPGMNGMEAITQIRRRYPDVRVLVMTFHTSEEHVKAALRAGCNGYILKNATQEELQSAIHIVLQGKTYLSAKISSKALSALTSAIGAEENRYDSLTLREREVLKLVAEGRSSKSIADYLCLSTKTVEKHRASLMRKLDLHNAAHLTAFAIRKGLVVSHFTRQGGSSQSSPQPIQAG